MVKHKDWDIDEIATGKIHKGKPIIGATFQNGLNDKNADGTYSPCDIRVSKVTQGVTHLKMNRGRMGELRFGDSSHPNSFLVKIKNKALKGVSFKYTGADGESMTANNGKPLCRFDNGISIESTPYYKGVKMDIIVNDLLTAPLEYPFSVKTYGQGYIVVEENEGLTFIGDDLESIYVKPPYAIDANGDIGPVDIYYTGMDGNLITFKKVVDETWLRQAATPVRIDPDVTIEDGVDGGVIEDSRLIGGNSSNYGVNIHLNFNDSTLPTYQTYVIRVDLSGEDSGRTVTFAKYIMNCNQTPSGGTFTAKLLPILRDWNEGTLNGSTQTGSVCGLSARYLEEDWTTGNALDDGTDYDGTTPTASFTTPSATGPYDIVCNNSVIQARLGATNKGDVAHPDSFTSGKAIRSSSTEGSGTLQFYYEYTEGAAFNPSWARNSNQIIGVSQ
jgi:hypothetical protein